METGPLGVFGVRVWLSHVQESVVTQLVDVHVLILYPNMVDHTVPDTSSKISLVSIMNNVQVRNRER